MILASRLFAEENPTWGTIAGFSSGDWWLLSALTMIVIAAGWARRWIQEDRTEKVDRTIILKSIEGVIDRLVDSRYEQEKSPESVANAILHTVERVVGLTLTENGASAEEITSISSNLMVYDRENENLCLMYFGTRLEGRETLTLPVNFDSPRSGAPKAIVKGEAIYVENTMGERYKDHFSEEKTYRSIISIPIRLKTRGFVGVLNIDSPSENQFQSTEFVKTEILPRLGPFIGLIKLQTDTLLVSQTST